MAVSHKCRPAKLERSLLPNCDGERRSTIELLPPRTAGQKLNLSALKGEVLRRSQDSTHTADQENVWQNAHREVKDRRIRDL
jgi:hypothetical protein